MRLIDADKIEPHERMDSFGGQYEPVMVAYMDDIDALPTVDAVPVQRCDGCRYADWHSNGCIAYCTKHGTDGHVADGFCSEGEKDGDHHDSN